MNAALNDIRSFIERDDLDARRKHPGSADFLNALFDLLDDLAAIAAAKHHDDAADDLLFSVLDGRALADSLPNADIGDIPHENGYALFGFYDDVFDIVHGLEETDAADEVLLGVALEDVATDVDVVLL